jgi:hypothetical protein
MNRYDPRRRATAPRRTDRGLPTTGYRGRSNHEFASNS